jgi:hypothetical protein
MGEWGRNSIIVVFVNPASLVHVHEEIQIVFIFVSRKSTDYAIISSIVDIRLIICNLVEGDNNFTVISMVRN